MVDIDKIIQSKSIRNVSFIFTILFLGIIAVIKISGMQLINYEYMIVLLAVSISTFILNTSFSLLDTVKQHTEDYKKVQTNINLLSNDVKNLSNEISDIKKDSAIRKADFETFNHLYTLYKKIPDVEVTIKVKQEILKEPTDYLNQLANSKKIEDMDPNTTFDISIPMLNNLSDGDLVIAVSQGGEWEKNKVWQRYMEANIKAVNNGATVERLFIMEKKELKEAIMKESSLEENELKVFKLHSKEQFEKTGLKGYFISTSDFNDRFPKLYNKFKSGFILISRKNGEKMAVIDEYNPKADDRTKIYRTTLTFAEEEITKLINNFYQVLAYSKELNQELFDSLN